MEMAEYFQGLKQLISEFHHRNPEAPQHISALDFANLPFHMITNLTDTPNMVPSDGYRVLCARMQCI